MIRSSQNDKNRLPPRRERGAVVVLFTIGMVAILVMAGLALDGGHMMLNKTRLQNSVDSAALAAAKALDQTGNAAFADLAARSVFGINANNAGNAEMARELGSINVTVEFSQTLNPFAAGTVPPEYVRVRARNFRLPAWFIRLLGINEKILEASAVAGPSPTILNACNLVPLIVCGLPPDQGGTPQNNWGYEDDSVHVLKSGSLQCGEQTEIGPGNFQLARLGGNGNDVVRENLAGGYQECQLQGDTIPTQPGVGTGPVSQGINTRFNKYSGGGMNADDYPPDVIIEQQGGTGLQYDECTDTISLDGQAVTDSSQLDFNYDDYLQRLAEADYDIQPPTSTFDRRTMPVIVADCSGINNGQSDLPILGFSCFFLLQEATQKGSDNFLYGEFAEECASQGVPGPAPGSAPGPHIIQLYRDYASTDS